MIRCLALAVVAGSIVFTLNNTAQAAEVSLPGDPPQFFTVTAVNAEGLVIQQRPLSSKLVDVPNIVYRPSLKTLQAMTANGKKLTAEELKNRLKIGSLVLVSPDEAPPESAYLSVLKEDTVILIDIFPRKGATGVQLGK